MLQMRSQHVFYMCLAVFPFITCQTVTANEPARVYQNRLQLIKNPQPLLADHPEFVQPIEEVRRYEAPILVNDEGADLSVRAWRFSYNARGIIEMPNRLGSAISVRRPKIISPHNIPVPSSIRFSSGCDHRSRW